MPDLPSSVSAIIPVYNGAKHLVDALASIREQTRAPEEVIVVDDGSTDGSAGIAESQGARVIRQANAGVAAARNAGVAVASGEVLAFLDQDDCWTPRKLELQLARLAAAPRLGYVTARQRITLEEGHARPSWLRPEHLEGPQDGYLPGTLAVWRHVFEAVGQFDSAFQTGSDADWFVRAKDAGIETEQLPEVLLHRRVHDRNESQRVDQNNAELLQMLRASLRRRAS